MANSQKPRKKYKPRPAIMPVTHGISDESKRTLKLIPHAELLKLAAGEGTEGSWHDLVSRLNFGYVLAERNNFGMDLKAPLKAALDAMVSIRERFDRVGKWGVSGDEQKLIGQALVYTDDMQDATTRREQRDCLRIVLETAT